MRIEPQSTSQQVDSSLINATGTIMLVLIGKCLITQVLACSFRTYVTTVGLV